MLDRREYLDGRIVLIHGDAFETACARIERAIEALMPQGIEEAAHG